MTNRTRDSWTFGALYELIIQLYMLQKVIIYVCKKKNSKKFVYPNIASKIEI